MERCPNCRARDEGGDSCRRCGMDFAPLRRVEQAAERLLVHAAGQLAKGDTAGAIGTLRRAATLRAEPLIGHLSGLARRLEQERGGRLSL